MSENRHFQINSFYHVYNRGVAKQVIYNDRSDFVQFLKALSFYIEDPPFRSLAESKRQPERLRDYLASIPVNPIVTVHAYCLMPNHFHLLLQELTDGGISRYLRLVQLSYTRHFNVRHRRVGPLFQGTFKAVSIDSDQQLLHLSRYIHLNPFVAKLTASTQNYPWSSLPNYFSNTSTRFCETSYILDQAGSGDSYKEFVENYAGYAQDLHAYKHSLLDA